MIAVVDYGMSNLRSVQRGLEATGATVELLGDPRGLEGAQGIVLPGDGAFGQTMENLTRNGWIDPLCKALDLGVPFFGICLGMQLLFELSEEMGEFSGLGLFRGHVKKFPTGKVPQIGWNQLRIKSGSEMLKGVQDGSYAYFVHSYYCDPEEDRVVMARTEYGIEYASVVERDHVWGAQFHPEKSGADGLTMLRNFCERV